jgi:hypothetical protein
MVVMAVRSTSLIGENITFEAFVARVGDPSF